MTSHFYISIRYFAKLNQQKVSGQAILDDDHLYHSPLTTRHAARDTQHESHNTYFIARGSCGVLGVSGDVFGGRQTVFFLCLKRALSKGWQGAFDYFPNLGGGI